MEDPFASLTSGMIHKPTMKQQQKSPTAANPRPPSSAGRQGPLSDGQRRPSNGSSVATGSYGQPMGNRYPSPMIPRTGAGDTNGMQSGDTSSMKHAGSEGSLSSLNNLGNLTFNRTPKNQSMNSSPMKSVSSSAGAPQQPASQPPPAPAREPDTQAAATAISADDFDNLFGSVPAKSTSDFGDVIGVDVFGGGVSSSQHTCSPTADPFDMFGDIGVSVSHTVSPPAVTPVDTAADIGSNEIGSTCFAPGSPEVASVERNADTVKGTVCATQSPSYEPPVFDVPVHPHTSDEAGGEFQAGSASEEPPPPSYEDVLRMARHPPNKASSSYREEGQTASSSPVVDPLHEVKEGHTGMQTSHVTPLPSRGKISRSASREKEKKKGMVPQVKNFGGYLFKHGARAAQDAQKALKEGMSHVRGAMAENLNRPSAQSSWKFRPDGEVEPPGVERPREAAHIQMAETLLGVDPSTREAMINAMDPDLRIAVEAILADLIDMSPEERSAVKLAASREQSPSSDIRTHNSRQSESPLSPYPSRSETGDSAQKGSAERMPSEPRPSPFEPFTEPHTVKTPTPQPQEEQVAANEPAVAAPEEEEEEEMADFLFNPDPQVAATTAAPAPPAAPVGWDEFITPVPNPVSNPDSMFGNLFGDSEAGSSNLSESSVRVSVRVDSHDTDTPERAALRAARAARVQKRMDDQLREKLERDQKEQVEREEQADLKSQIAAKVQHWKKKSNGNIVALLASLQDVLWEGSGWTPISMGDLLSDAGVKKGWRKANLLVHPDKVKQKGGDVATLVLADFIFDNLKEAYAKYKPMGV